MTEDNDATMDRQERLREAGAWLRTQRETRGWSGTELARLLEVNQVRVSSYENGRNEVPSEIAERLAAVLGLSLIEIRKNLGLWVPADSELRDYQRRADPSQLADDVLLTELIRRYQQRGDREILNVYPQRSDVPGTLWDRLFTRARAEIFLGGYTNYFFWAERSHFGELLRDKAAAGVRVRILVGDPTGAVTQRREQVENVPLTVGTRIRITLDELQKMGPVPGLEVRLSDVNAEAHVSRSIFRIDQEALVCEHIADRLGHGSLTFHLRRMQKGGPFDQYSAHLEHLWDGAKAWVPGE
jgi:transcriptional regulator with XRE-family HTH domain